MLVVLVAGKASAQVVDTTLWITDGTIASVVRDGNTIYVGGYFGEVGPATGGGVPVGTASGAPVRPFPKVQGTVRATAADGSDGWYIGGDFSAVGGLERSNLAHVLADGSVADWSPNPNGAVHALAFDGERVYAGGEFTWIGWRWRDGIAALDGTTGTATAWNPGADALVRTLAVSGSTVYAGGDFTTIGGRVRNRIAALDAATGATTAWDPNANAAVRAIVFEGSLVYAGGEFTTIGGQSLEYLVALDAVTGVATNWRPSPDRSVWALAMSGSTVYAGGFFTSIGGQERSRIAALDAASGAALAWDPNANSLVRTLAVGNGVVYVGGSFTTIGGQPRRQAAALDAAAGTATSWDPRPGGFDPTVHALSLSGSRVYLGGSFTIVGGVTRRYIAALDATTGMATDWNPDANAPVYALAVGSGTVYAGGSFSGIGGKVRNRLAALDAATGAATPWDPNPSGSPNWPEIRALAVHGTMVYAAGTFNEIGGQVRNHVAALDAATGAAVSWNPDANGSVHALEVSGSTVYAGGLFSRIGGQSRNNIAALDAAGGAATPWNPNANTLVSALAAGEGVVYAGGVFTTIGGQSRRHIAALNAASGAATAWDPGANQWMYALAVGEGVVYAGGDCTTIGGQERVGVAALDAVTGRATVWNAGVTGSGVVRALAVDGSKVLVGGGFRGMGGQPRSHLAAITAAVPDPVPDPTFPAPIVISAQTIALGDSVTITAGVRNDGAASDDGRIVFSFKDLTDPLDVQRVRAGAADDVPGTRVLPAGSLLSDRDGQPVTASYLVLEYVDADWRGLGNEVNTLTVTARPRTAGVFSIDVRSTMRAEGGPPFAFVSDLPSDGHTYLTDQQGWTVRRFVVYVSGPPTVAVEPGSVTVPARAELALAGASPNPARMELTVGFTLPRSGAGALELYDLRGRRVARRDLSDLGAGAHRVELARGRVLAAGVYLVRLTHGGRVLTAKVCVVR